MQVLITGGAGYIGSHVNHFLQKHNIQTIVIDNLSNGYINSIEGTKFFNGNFGDIKLLSQIFTKYKIDAVIHLGASASVPDSVINPSLYYENNVINMKNLLDACVTFNIKNFLFSSSASTFGEPKYTPIDELHPQIPINPYGYTKLIGEKMLSDYHNAYGINYCIFRYFCAAGAEKTGLIGEAHNPETHLIPVFIKKAINNEVIPVFGLDYDTNDGSCIRDFIHVLDLANAHLKVLKQMQDGIFISNDFNLGSGKGFSVLEMINEIEIALNKKIQYINNGRRLGDPSILIANYSKAYNILGWAPEHSNITEIINDAVNWERGRKY